MYKYLFCKTTNLIIIIISNWKHLKLKNSVIYILSCYAIHLMKILNNSFEFKIYHFIFKFLSVHLFKYWISFFLCFNCVYYLMFFLIHNSNEELLRTVNLLKLKRFCKKKSRVNIKNPMFLLNWVNYGAELTGIKFKLCSCLDKLI